MSQPLRGLYNVPCNGEHRFESCPDYKWKTANIGRISTVEREPGSQRIATLTESYHAPGSDVGDPALLCTAPGNGEQTVDKYFDHINAYGSQVFHHAPLAELVDALVLGTSLRVRVRVSQGVQSGGYICSQVGAKPITNEVSATVVRFRSREDWAQMASSQVT